MTILQKTQRTHSCINDSLYILPYVYIICFVLVLCFICFTVHQYSIGHTAPRTHLEQQNKSFVLFFKTCFDDVNVELSCVNSHQPVVLILPQYATVSHLQRSGTHVWH